MMKGLRNDMRSRHILLVVVVEVWTFRAIDVLCGVVYVFNDVYDVYDV